MPYSCLRYTWSVLQLSLSHRGQQLPLSGYSDGVMPSIPCMACAFHIASSLAAFSPSAASVSELIDERQHNAWGQRLISLCMHAGPALDEGDQVRAEHASPPCTPENQPSVDEAGLETPLGGTALPQPGLRRIDSGLTGLAAPRADEVAAHVDITTDSSPGLPAPAGESISPFVCTQGSMMYFACHKPGQSISCTWIDQDITLISSILPSSICSV